MLVLQARAVFLAAPPMLMLPSGSPLFQQRPEDHPSGFVLIITRQLTVLQVSEDSP